MKVCMVLRGMGTSLDNIPKNNNKKNIFKKKGGGGGKEGNKRT